MKRVSYLVLFVLICTSFLIFNLIFSYTLDYIFLNLLKLSKYTLVPFIVKLSSMLISMNTSIKLIFKYFYVERTSVKKLINLIKIFIVLYSLILVLIYSSNFIPCASIIEYDYPNIFKKEFKEISKLIKGRFDMHLSEYCILNSTNKEVVKRSIDEIKYHYKLLKSFKVKPNLIIHIGSKSFGKENSITRFINNFNKLPNYLKNTLLIENDDKVFNVEDTLRLCQKIKRPMVLDVHHHNCNKAEKDLSNYLNEIFNTWDTTPKIHFSSPKNKKDFRAHNDFINSDDFINFIKLIDRDIDVMLEAKAKDDALFRLVRELKYKTNYIFLDETTIKKDL